MPDKGNQNRCRSAPGNKIACMSLAVSRGMCPAQDSLSELMLMPRAELTSKEPSKSPAA